MSILNWPDDAAFAPRSQKLMQMVDRAYINSPLTGKRWTRSRWAKWGWQLEFGAEQLFAERSRLHGFLSYVLAGNHYLRLPHFKHQEPHGTVKRSGITCLSAPSFSTAMVMAGGNAGGTLLSGDWFSVGDQLYRCGEDAVFDGNGFASIKFSNMARSAIFNQAPVNFSSPVATYALRETELQLPEDPGEAQQGFTIVVEEVW